METTTGITVYTTDEYNNAVCNAKLEGIAVCNKNNSTSALDVFKSEVRDGSLGRDYASNLYNTIAEACGWETVSTIATTYTVEVIYANNVIGSFEGIEADSEDEAQDKVMDELEVDNPVLSFTVSFNGDSFQAEYEPDTYDIQTELELSATEEEV